MLVELINAFLVVCDRSGNNVGVARAFPDPKGKWCTDAFATAVLLELGVTRVGYLLADAKLVGHRHGYNLLGSLSRFMCPSKGGYYAPRAWKQLPKIAILPRSKNTALFPLKVQHDLFEVMDALFSDILDGFASSILAVTKDKKAFVDKVASALKGKIGVHGFGWRYCTDQVRLLSLALYTVGPSVALGTNSRHV